MNRVPPSIPYVSDLLHAVLAEGAGTLAGPNVRSRGANLTVSFLSLNRPSLAIRLLRSIAEHLPGFAGEVLVVDNGSGMAELAAIRDALATFPFRSRLVELGADLGVARGRNRTMQHLRTDWVMCLDEDVYFIADPLDAIQDDIATLGCHFLNLPLLDADRDALVAGGGHLHLTVLGNDLHVGGGSAMRHTPHDGARKAPFLSTYLFGGACVLNRSTFEQAGGYDEAYFIGFEDLDLSIRLFRQGLKVGNTGAVALVHDPRPDDETCRDPRRGEAALEALRRSAAHFERKHDMRVLSSDAETAAPERARTHREPALEPSRPLVHAAGKPRVALVIDTENWAFANISRQLERYLGDRFEFTRIPMEVIDNVDQVFLLADGCDIVHFFWRETLGLVGSPFHRSYVESLGCSYERFHERYIKSRIITTAIYDHLFLSESELRDRRWVHAELVSAYYTVSRRLAELYRRASGYPAPAAVLEDGVDLTLFRPKRLERLGRPGERALAVGWAGNSRWSADIEDFKGLHTILKPALEELAAEGVPVRPFFADRAERMIPHTAMPDYYGEIDVYVCSSKIEGTPNPVLEAMACGVPVISTDVGIVPQAFGPKQSRFILEERSVASLKSALRRLVAEPSLLRELSDENLARIEDWDWSRKALGFGEFFGEALRRRAARAG
jgi:glycosyltransferase involved in cell wall biosynthesis/GT2 family glycosyltransferase